MDKIFVATSHRLKKEEIWIEEYFLKKIKLIHSKPTANIIIDGGKLKTCLQKSRMKQDVHSHDSDSV